MLNLSLRKVLIGGHLALALVTSAIIVLIGVRSINDSVLKNAQQVANRSLDIASSLYEQRFSADALQLEHFTSALAPELPTAQVLAQQLLDLKNKLGFAVLNLCSSEGKPLAGTYQDLSLLVPVREDPVLQSALRGKPTWGTVLLSSVRLRFEGGAALANSAALRLPPGQNTGTIEEALLQWFAVPVFDAGGRIFALLYGGRLINGNSELVDALRATLFGTELYASKPLGTVTFFLRGIRAATNVLTENGERAVGTRVSPQVEKEVLEHGRPWQARAWVVDSWYLSSYVPLRDKNEKIVGMLYVGLLEAPYAALRADLLVRFLIPVLVVLLFAAAASIAVVKRVSQPLEVLRHTAETIACGQLDAAVPEHKTYTEIADFTAAFRRMHQAIKERDEKLRRQNQLLSETNDSLVRANNNYMGTLGFVTHELKAPLAAMQSFIDVLERGTLGELQEPVRQVLRRIKRNCEELQDMVKNYLDLSRAEQGEFTPQMSACDFIADVVEPVVEHTSALFLSRGITLNIAAPKSIPLTGDAELLRITLTNYLSNAAKYGRENSAAELRISAANNELLAVVRNEGEGFTPGEEVNLFKKFVRLKNAASRGKRGSGLGLFLCKLAVELHGGTVSAYSEPGAWAEFSFRLPLPTAQAAGDAIR